VNMQEKLQEALRFAGNVYTLEDIKKEIDEGNMQSWVAPDGTWVVTRLVRFPRKLALEVILYVGSLGGLDSLWPRVLDFARAEGATVIRAIGRPGWKRFMSRYGWQYHTIQYVREL